MASVHVWCRDVERAERRIYIHITGGDPHHRIIRAVQDSLACLALSLKKEESDAANTKQISTNSINCRRINPLNHAWHASGAIAYYTSCEQTDRTLTTEGE